jgi:hypothetical protein
MTSTIKRSLIYSFLNTGTVGSPTWSLIGDGVTSAKISYNPETTKETYVHLDSASVSVDSYAPTFPLEMTAKNGDAVFEYVDALRKQQAVGAAADTEAVNVWLYKTPALTYYLAEKRSCSVQIDDMGGDAGKPAKLNYTLNYKGDLVVGTFSPTALAFVAAPVNTILTTMVIGSVVLTPLFSADHSWLWYAGSVAAATVTMTSTLTGATIVQKVGASVVSQGGAAALSLGINHLTIDVTVGAEVTQYHIDITRTA